MTRTCTDCARELPLADFTEKSGRLLRQCRECVRARSRASYRRLNGSVVNLASSAAPEFARNTLWSYTDDRGREVVMRVAAVTGNAGANGICVQGYIGSKLVRPSVKWLRANAKPVST